MSPVVRDSKLVPAKIAEKRRRAEYGDFQTPPELAEAVCRTLAAERPVTIVEPSCGTGTFLTAAIGQFPRARLALGMEVNAAYLAAARRSAELTETNVERRLRVADFFRTDWKLELSRCPAPILIIGNPPWVTNSALGVLGSRNHPRKENARGWSGVEAITGKSNFDVSEWMLCRLLEAIGERSATLAMLCKTSVARKVLAHAWDSQLPIASCEVRRIDALEHFGANVDACLLICRMTTGGQRSHSQPADCPIFASLTAPRAERAFGLRDDRIVADIRAYERVRPFVGGAFRWRSGVKHDCAAVFEFRERDGELTNGVGEIVDLESRYLYPLLKSSQVASGAVARPRRMVLVPQRKVGEETASIARHAPRTWEYLLRHADRLDRRASTIYRKQPRFSVFGVGPYSFAKWKVAVSGFYKTWRFVAVGPFQNRPVLCDDTCYFLPCRSAAEARARATALNSDFGREFFSAFVHPEAKRPLTSEILGLANVDALIGCS